MLRDQNKGVATALGHEHDACFSPKTSGKVTFIREQQDLKKSHLTKISDIINCCGANAKDTKLAKILLKDLQNENKLK